MNKNKLLRELTDMFRLKTEYEWRQIGPDAIEISWKPEPDKPDIEKELCWKCKLELPKEKILVVNIAGKRWRMCEECLEAERERLRKRK